MSEVLRDELADETAAEALRESAEEEAFVVDSDAKAEWCMQQITKVWSNRPGISITISKIESDRYEG